MLLTKLFIPELRASRVIRTRLVERLNAASACRLVLVSAPAGFGKTTLVGEWIAQTQPAAAWISLDENDNDPALFWPYLIAAIDGLFPGAGKSARALLTAGPQQPSQAVVGALLNDLAGRTRSQRSQPSACLVLDDIHRVTHPAIFDGLLLLIEHLPPGLRLALIGRSDPPLPLGRLRAAGLLLEVRAADLRFTAEESRQFLNDVMGFALPSDDVSRLEERTEGWIAGLQLAALALNSLERQTQPDTTQADPQTLRDFIATFSGDDRYVLDYLLEEVLNRQPPAVSSFLMQTAILERLCGDLCEAVASLPAGDGQAMLERLERDNLFLVPLDHRRRWYRYHHLFADLLRHQLNREQPGAAQALHRRASDWLAAQNLTVEAIYHALQGQDFERAALLIDPLAWDLMQRGEYATLVHWAEALPEQVLYNRAHLLLAYAWALSYLGEVERWQRPLETAENLWRAQGNYAGLGEALLLRADFAATYGNGAEAARLAHEALDLLPEADAHHRGSAWLYLGSQPLLENNLPDAKAAFERAMELCAAGQNRIGLRQARNALAQVALLQGRLHDANELLLATLSETGDLPIYEGLTARLLLGSLYREWNRLDEAVSLMSHALEKASQAGQDVYMHLYYLHLALTHWALGNQEQMKISLSQQATIAEKIGDQPGLRQGQAIRAQIDALSGRQAEAVAWRETCQLPLDPPFDPTHETEYLALCRVLAQQGAEPARSALRILRALEKTAADQGRTASQIEILVSLAITCSSLGDDPGAMQVLHHVLTLSEAGGYTRVYLDEGPPMQGLLRELARQTRDSSLQRAIQRLLERTPVSAAPETATHVPTQAFRDLVEPLTPREIEVLQLIQAGLSNRDIAAQLYLSLNTVKVHIKNIYGKLEVESRTQAVKKAVESQLI